MSLQEPAKMELGDGVHIEYRPGNENLLVTVGRESRQIKYAELFAAAFAIATPMEQEKLLPVRQTEMMTYEKVHVVEVKKDLKRGEKMRFRCKVDVPLTIVESLNGLIAEKPASPILLPR